MKCNVKECVKCEKFSPLAIATSLPGEAGIVNAPFLSTRILSGPTQLSVIMWFFIFHYVFNFPRALS